MNSYLRSGPNMGRRSANRRNFFLEDSKAAAEDSRVNLEIQNDENFDPSDRSIEVERARLINIGFNWMQQFTTESTPQHGTKKIVIDCEQNMIETYFVKELFDEAVHIASEHCEVIEKEAQQILTQDEKVKFHYFTEINETRKFTKYINQDDTLAQLFAKLPTARKIVTWLNKSIEDKSKLRELDNYNVINNFKNIELLEYKDMLSVFVRKEDVALKQYLLGYKNIFVDLKSVVSTDHQKKIDDFQNSGKYDKSFNYSSIWTLNYLKFKTEIKKIIVYDFDFSYPRDYLQPQDKENIVIMPHRIMKSKDGEAFYRLNRNYHYNDINYRLFYDRSFKMKNDVNIVHDILNYFMKNKLIEVGINFRKDV